jgi:hypothetical protein
MAQWNKQTLAYRSIGGQSHDTTLHEVTLQADRYGNIITPGATATSAFGEPISVPITPIIQLDSLYGFDPREFQTFSFGTGSFEDTGTLFKAHTGTGAYGYGVIRSNRILRYRPGQGALCRFTAAFENPQADVTLRAGFFAQEQSLVIGYNGTQFGVLRENGGKAHIHEFTITAGGTGTANITLNGVTTNVAIASTNTQVVATTIAAASFTGWTVEQCDNKVRFLSNSVGPLAGAFSYGGTGSATLAVLQTGVAHTTNWTYQADFNIDKLDGTGPSKITIDPSKLNIFQISYRWLGAGEIRYAIEDSLTGDMIFFHHEHYSNRNTDVHLDNPSFRIGYVAANLGAGTITDAHTSGASMMAAIEGLEQDNAFTTASGTSKTSLSSGSTHHLIGLKNATIYQNKINLRQVKLKRLDIAAQSNDPLQIYMIINATKSATQSYVKVADFSCIILDTADGTYTIPNEHVLAQFVVPAGGTLNVNLDSLESTIPPGSSIDICVSSGQSIQSIATAVTWIEV